MAKKKKLARKRLVLFLPICLALIVAIGTTVGASWAQIIGKYAERNELKKEIVRLREKEAELEVDVRKLEDPDYVARFARERYMYSKEGEIILRLPGD